MDNVDDAPDASRPEHDCETSGTLAFVAHHGAPGVGQAWACTTCGKAWSRVDGRFWPADTGVHVLRLADVE